MIFAVAVLALVVGFIVGSAWPKAPPPKPEKPKVIGYDSKGKLIHERSKSKLDVRA